MFHHSYDIVVTAATQLTDKTSPTSHSSTLIVLDQDGSDIRTFSSLFQFLTEQNTFDAISFDIKNKTLIAIQVSGIDKTDPTQTLTLAVTELESKCQRHFKFFSTVTAIKFIFRPTKLLSQKVFNCPIHGHIK